MHFSKIRYHHARQRHRCTWCWQHIEVGDDYCRYRSFDEGEAATVKLHPECHEALLEAAREEGGTIEWTPGQERPAQQSTQHLPKGK